jgi:hypothetical protein
MDIPGKTQDRVLGGNGNLAREFEHGFETAREKVNELGRSLSAFVRERPGTALAIALGAGYLVGRLLRR